MQKILLLITAMAVALFSQAKTLTPQQALERVDKDVVVNGKRAAAAARISASPKLLHTALASDGEPAVYVFAGRTGDGFMVVSADDIAAPVLGYVDEGSYDSLTPMPPQLQWWLEQYAGEIAFARKNPLAVNAMGVNTSRAAEDRALVAPLLSTKWNQTAPYNGQTPVVDGVHAVTGCVATALSQVMNYHKWPEKGHGEVRATVQDKNGKTSTQMLDLSTVAFDWDNMLDDYSGNDYTDAQALAVATLMKACGFAAGMLYTANESGASSYDAFEALRNNFDYSPDIQFCQRADYGGEAWDDLIYNSLASTGPVYYSGRSTTGGHAFVCDGYSGDGFFHFNWGWGGYFNGSFTLSALYPDGIGTGGFAGGYNFMQAAFIGVKKNTGETTAPQVTLQYYGAMDATVENGVFSIKTPVYTGHDTGVSLNAAAGYLIESEAGGTQINVPSAMQRFDGAILYDMPAFNVSDYVTADGRYKVYGTYTPDGSDVPRTIKVGGMNPDYVVLVVNGGNYSVEISTPGKLSLENINAPSEIAMLYPYGVVMSELRLKYSAANTGQNEGAWGVAMRIRDTSGQLVAVGTGEYLDLLPGESREVESKFTLTFYRMYEQDKVYKADLYDPNIYAVPSQAVPLVELPDVTIRKYTDAGLEFTGFGLVNGGTNAPLDDIKMKATVTCTSGFYNDECLLAFYDALGQVAEFSVPLDIKEGETKDIFFNANLNGTVPGKKYAAVLFILKTDVEEPYYYYGNVAECSVITDEASGVENISVGQDGIGFEYDAATCTAVVCADAGVAGMEAYGISGARLNIPVAIAGGEASADLSQLPEGVVLLRVSTTDGHQKVFKMVR